MAKKIKVEIEENTGSPKGGLLSLFAKKDKIYQAKVRGKFRHTKWLIMYPLLLIYYGLPWLRWDRGAGVPDQAVMWDIANRKFYFFFIEVWPQEIYILTGLLTLAALALFLFTTLFGRVWCGYTCPQTVWTDLFLSIERLVEGDRHRRIRLDKKPLSLKKIRLKITKHFLWLLISLFTGGAWVFYFTDAPTFWHNLNEGHINAVPAFWISFLTFTTYLMAGFAREQVCAYMCPYARFQGSMFDKETLVVAYDEKRGEPRGKLNETEGSCVDCGRCVAVCPVGIDIRDGQQYQCINCALCIDACNEIMKKTHQPLNLIRYTSINNKSFKEVKLIRPRTIIYSLLIAIVIGLITFAMTKGRELVEVNIIHSRSPLYIKLSNGTIRNIYKLHLVNKMHKNINLNLTISGVEKAHLHAPRLKKEVGDNLDIKVNSGKTKTFKIFVEVPSAYAKKGKQDLLFKLNNDQLKKQYETYFIGGE